MKLISSLISLLVILSVATADYQYSHCKFPDSQESVKILSDGVTTTFFFDVSGGLLRLSDGTYGASINTFGYNPENRFELGPVYNPDDSVIGCSSTTNGLYRVGDLGNIVIENAVSTTQFTSTRAKLNGDSSIVGRSIVIYNSAYDCNTPANSALKTVAGSCVIGIGGATGIPTTPFLVNGTNTAAASTSISLVDNDAMVVLANTNKTDTTITGEVLFRSNSSSNIITITALVNSLTNSSHGFHIHAFGDLSANDGTSIGGHWAATGQTHALPNSLTRHYGDLGNICFFDKIFQTASYKFATNYITLPGLVGRGFAVHAARDDGLTVVGGDRVAQGVVALIPKAAASTIDVPEWNYNVECTTGGVYGPEVTPTPSVTSTPTPTKSTTPTPTQTPSSEDGSNSSSYVSPFIGLVLISLISTLFF